MQNPEDSIQDQNTSNNLEKLQAKLQSLHQSYQSLELKHKDTEENLVYFQQQYEDAQKKNMEFSRTIEELSIERDNLKGEIFGVEERAREKEEELKRRVDDGLREKEGLEVEIYEGVKEREELVRKINVGMGEKEELLKENLSLKGRVKGFEENLSTCLGFLGSIKECLVRVSEGLDGMVDEGCEGEEVGIENIEEKVEEWKEMREFLGELGFVSRIAKRVEAKISSFREKEDLLKEIEAHKRRKEEFDECLSSNLEALGKMKVSLMRASEGLDEEEAETKVDFESKEVANFEEKSEELKELRSFSTDLWFVSKTVERVEEKLRDYQEKVKKDKKELVNSVVSLTEENRDINTLLRIALHEKEAVEKKLKGSNEQKNLLHIAGKGLFGFMTGGASNEHSNNGHQKKENPQISERMRSNASTVSDVSSECEEEVVSLASTVEKMMKNLHIEIAQLRRALEESRSDTERLQNSTEKQAQQILEQTIYIKELENRKRILSENVEQLLIEIKAAEEDVERWREACELEVEAGKRAVAERDKVIAILQKELEKTKAALKASDSKLKLKDDLAVAAMAAQSAAERSLQLADSRAARLHVRIEELTKQLEETDRREKNRRHKVRRICWPWKFFFNASNPTTMYMLPEMQALFHRV